MPVYNGKRIGSNNDPFAGTKSDDLNYSDVSLLLNGNGSNNSTTFTDSSTNNHSITRVGSTIISTAESKFGGSSIAFLGSGANRLSVPNDTSFQFGTDDFTIECWVYVTSFGSNADANKNRLTTFLKWDGASLSSRFGIGILSSGINLDSTYLGSLSFTEVQSVTNSVNTWYHIALVRSGNSLYIFRDGVLHKQATVSESQSFTAPGDVHIGGYPTGYTVGNGYIDDLRITKGVGRYTSNFTPPTAQLPGGETGTFASGMWTLEEHSAAIRNELWPGAFVTNGLILNLDAGNSNSYSGSGTTWTDLSGNGNDGTISGATYDSANGGSLSFDGSNDYVSNVDPGLSDVQAEGELTYEYWIQPTQAIYASFTQSTSGLAYFSPGTPQGLTNSAGYKYNNQTYAALLFAFGTNGFVAGTHNNSYAPPFLVDYNSYTGISHLTVIKSAYGCSYYINGVFKKSATQSRILGVVPDRVTSNSSDYFGRYFKGNIYSYRFYNRALTAAEVTQNYNAHKGRYGL